MHNQPTTTSTTSSTVQWRGRKLAKRVWVCNRDLKFLFHVTPDQALLLLAQKTVLAAEKDPGKLWRVVLALTPGPVKGPCHVASMRDFATPASVIYKRNTQSIMALGSFEFDENKFDNQDRWAYVLSITENIKQQPRIMKS